MDLSVGLLRPGLLMDKPDQHAFGYRRYPERRLFGSLVELVGIEPATS